MMPQKRIVWIAIPLIAVFWFNSANSSSLTVTGVTVNAGASNTEVGLTTTDGKIEYYIPLSDSAVGTYGVTSIGCGLAGTCSDSGDGSGYDNADALDMNIFFDLSGPPQSAPARLDLVFDDLDLTDINDPNNFFESMSFSFWNGTDFTQLNSTIKSSIDLADPSFTDGVVDASALDPITWSLDLASLGILGDLNNSQSSHNGFWIQLGFGSEFDRNVSNTSEYLSAALTVSAVPIPAAAWLFGSALIGLLGFGKRSKTA